MVVLSPVIARVANLVVNIRVVVMQSTLAQNHRCQHRRSRYGQWASRCSCSWRQASLLVVLSPSLQGHNRPPGYILGSYIYMQSYRSDAQTPSVVIADPGAGRWVFGAVAVGVEDIIDSGICRHHRHRQPDPLLADRYNRYRHRCHRHQHRRSRCKRWASRRAVRSWRRVHHLRVVLSPSLQASPI